MVLNRIVEQIESVCNNHQKVNVFIYGDDEVIHGQDQREYILAWLSFGDQSFTLSNDNNNMVKLNFTLWILDKINNELDISSARPLLKVLDRAENAVPLPRSISRKVLFRTFIVSLIGCALVILIDYAKRSII